MAKNKFYAVRCGREGAKVYTSWPKCEANVSRWPGARHKSFSTHEAALAWLEQPDRSYVESPASTSHLWSKDMDSHTESSTPGISPYVPPDLEPSTADVIPLPTSSPPRCTSPNRTVCLSEEQEHILELVRGGTNIFFTGSAGTGKSVLLREIINHFGGKVSEDLAITASTGIAAVNIGGTTLHSFAGIGLGTESAEKLVKKILLSKNSKKRWRRTRTLIIDEISMVDGNLFDKLETVARVVRGNDEPFGGIQLVLSGDFFQLPPVPERRNNAIVPILFAFEARSWNRCFGDIQSKGSSVYQLTQVFRQRDQAFVDMLGAMRNGRLDATTTALFRELSRPIHYSDGFEPCELFPRREQVNKANQARLQLINEASRLYKAMDVGGYDIYNQAVNPDQAKKLLDRLIAPELIELKIGAQVMLIKNLVQSHLVNGTLGKVIGFQSLKEARRTSTEIAQIDHSKDFETSRHLQDDIRSRDSEIAADNLWPLIRFTNGKTLLLTPAEFEAVNVHGEMEAQRDQIPLILAWALSIHKSQGQTLERVKVDLGKTFEKGQAYVALSRATSMDGLQILNFDPSKVMAHPRVLAWQEKVGQNDKKQTAQPSPTLKRFDGDDKFENLVGNSMEKLDSLTPSVEPYDGFDTLEAIKSYWSVPL